MPTAKVRRQVSGKYYRRVEAIKGGTEALRKLAAIDMATAVRKGTIVQLYMRTPLKVTKNMFRSIGSAVTPNGAVAGFNMDPLYNNLPYVIRRLKMTGFSKKGGHLLNMSFERYVGLYAVRKINLRHAKWHNIMLAAKNTPGYTATGQLKKLVEMAEKRTAKYPKTIGKHKDTSNKRIPTQRRSTKGMSLPGRPRKS